MINDIRSFFYNYLHVIFGRAISGAVIDFFSLLLIVRVLTPDSYGVYVLFGSVAIIISVLTTWASSAIIRFGREEFILEHSVKKTFWASCSITLPAFGLCFLLIFIFRGWLADYIGIASGYYYLIFIYILAINLILIVASVFQAVGKIKQFAYLPIIYSSIFLAVLMGYYFSSVTPPVELIIGINIMCNLVTIIIGLWLLRKDISPPSFSREWTRKCFSYSWPMSIGGVSEQIIGNIDQIMIKVYLPVSSVGIYSIAYRIFSYLITIPMLSISLTFPMFTSMIVEKKESAIAQYIKNYAPIIAFLWAALLSVPIIFSREIFLIFGPDYSAAALPFSILLFGLAFRIFSIIESPIFSSYAIIKEVVAVSVLISLLNLGLDYLLIPLMGISGAAVATTVAFTVGNVIRSWILYKKLGMNDLVNYIWILPALLSFGGSVAMSSLAFRSILFVGIIGCSFLVVKRVHIFNAESLGIIDSIDMPVWLRQTIRRAYSWLM